MTIKERHNPRILRSSRLKRIADGSGEMHKMMEAMQSKLYKVERSQLLLKMAM